MSAKIISFVNQKGGSGKTTLLMLTAVALHRRSGKKILVIDSDPQLSVKRVLKAENNPDSYDVFAFNWAQPKPEINFEKVLLLAKRKYDLILMDLPGNIRAEEFYFSILYSDILMVPVVAGTLNINATVDFLNLLPKFNSKREGKDPEVFGVINKKDQTIEYNDLNQLEGLGKMKLFYSTLSNLVRYKRQISTYKDITDPKDSEDEFNRYFDEFRAKCFV